MNNRNVDNKEYDMNYLIGNVVNMNILLNTGRSVEMLDRNYIGSE